METTCPVFRPTIEEFSNFQEYIHHIERECSSGIVKVIPPEGWFTRDYHMSPDWSVVTPIRQEVIAYQAGVYQVVLHEKNNKKYKDFVEYDKKNSYHSDNFEDREREFWQYMGNKGKYADPIYGADMSGSLFGEHNSAWNLKYLQTPLKLIESNLPGVTSPMLYVGTWRAMFCYHTEDMDLYSINYLHTGAPKSWYSIPVSYRQRFENFMQGQFTTEYNKCHEYLRHKNSIVSKSKLKSAGISFDTVVQMPGEFVITFPGAYHAGFNHGLNIAEATNFCTEKWLKIGRLANICLCRPNSVSIDMDYVETLILRKRISDKKVVNVVRCCCGLRADGMPKRNELLTCRYCGAQFHEGCVTTALPKAVQNECHVCASIRLRDAEENAELTEEEWDAYNNEMRAKEKYFSENPLKKGSNVYVRLFPPMGTGEGPCWVKGTVVDICEDSFKFHVKPIKGKRRHKDVWIDLNNYNRISPASEPWNTQHGSQESGKKRRHTSDRKPRAKRISNHSSASPSTPLLLNPSIVRKKTSSQVSDSSVTSFVIDDMLDYTASLPIPSFLQPFLSDETEFVNNGFLPRNTSLPLPTREQIVVNVIDGLCNLKH